MISYEPLWKTMKDRGVSKYTLIYKMGFSAFTSFFLFVSGLCSLFFMY